MGKSTASDMFRQFGMPVFDADASVHRMIATDKAVISEIAAAFSDYQNSDGSIDIKGLAKDSFFDDATIAKLENILHPFVLTDMVHFLNYQESKRSIRVVLDVPLLFEVGWDAYCDCVILVHSPANIQKNRVLLRENMTIEKFSAIKNRQMPEIEKLQKANYIVSTSMGFRNTRLRLTEILRDICVK
ncbi:MAG: dephospho-CoA kinase [Alphaproteobacteria bacterium]|nr:dephospho-CoA kinase [Alphaproteobacteria bacterium]